MKSAARIVRTLIGTPLANPFDERFVGALRRGELRMVIFGRADLESTLRIYVEHYNSHRPRRALDMAST
jgi:hypothetical protein